MSDLKTLFEEKIRLLSAFLGKTREYRKALEEEGISLDRKVDLIDEMSDAREVNLKTMQALDRQIEIARNTHGAAELAKLQGDPGFKDQLERTLRLIQEIQLTDQSLFLYIQTTGSEIRSTILKSLKEKEAVSKFKSQSQNPTGDEVDKTI